MLLCLYFDPGYLLHSLGFSDSIYIDNFQISGENDVWWENYMAKCLNICLGWSPVTYKMLMRDLITFTPESVGENTGPGYIA